MLEHLVNRYRLYPLALVGCRAKGVAYDVCEYNILMLKDAYSNSIHDYYGSGRGRGEASDSSMVGAPTAKGPMWYEPCSDDEYIYMDDGSISRIHVVGKGASMVEKVMLLDGMVILNDVNNRLSMLEDEVAALSRKVKRLHARTVMVDALFYASNALHARDALEASFWLKSAACSYMESLILSGEGVPMPSHILAQMRASGDSSMSTAIDSLGLEQANRSSVSRGIRALMHILASSYCGRLALMLIRKKLEYLSSMGMYTDAHTYICYICRGLVLGRGIGMGRVRSAPGYSMLAVAMNLTSDHTNTSRLAGELLSLCRSRLNAY
ncbi:MAG: hypothetical protein RMJ59_02325 [Candidatus Nitrosocaldus sp.]|nr:hypothetical protein [Candidatus Nitrosocaldus sp.]MDW8275204.1 hypothetical protein [Candidatus Nitrosocaldus sp.]